LAAAAAAILVLGACSPTHGSTSPSSEPTVATVPGASTHLVPAAHYRSDPAGADSRRHAMLTYLATLPNALKLGPVHGGDFVSTSWCVPKSAPYCPRALQTQGQLGGPGLVVTVDGVTFASSGPATSALDFSSQYIPDAANQLAIEFEYSEDGGGLFGAGWQLEFVYLTPALRTQLMGIQPVDYFNTNGLSGAFGNELDFADIPVYETGTGVTIGLPADAPTALESLSRYFGSAPQLRSRMMAREAQLLRLVLADIDDGRVTKPVDCQNSPHGEPPICGRGALSSAEKAQERAGAKAQIGANETFVARHYRQMYALVDQKLFWHSCQSCWS
jgi:hypothetical protein